MPADDNGGWQETHRGRRARRDPGADHGRQPEPGQRDVQQWTEEQPWDTAPGGRPGSDPYQRQPGYDARNWTGEQDTYSGRTDPSGSYYGGQPYDPRAEYPSQPPYRLDDYPSQPPNGADEYPSQPPYRADEYPSQPPYRSADYPSQPPLYRPGEHPSQPPYRAADYPSQPSPYRPDEYPSQPPAGAGRGGYLPADYVEPYPGRPGYSPEPGFQDGPGLESQPPFGSPQPYGSQPAYGEQDALTGQNPYQDPAQFGAGAYAADNNHRDGSARYGQDYDGYGARSGPLPSFADDDQAAWQAQGAGAARGRGTDPGHAARRGDRASAEQQEDVGHDGPLGGSRRSGRSMDAEDDRHSGFFAGYASNDDDHYGGPPRRRRGRGRAAGLIALILVVVLLGGLGLTGYHFYSQYKHSHASYSGNGYGSADIIVPSGATAVSISQQLLRRGVIASVDSFVAYVNTSKNPTGLQPGEFRLHQHMGNAQAWTMLTNGKNKVNSDVAIPDGLPNSKILPLLAKKSGIPLSDFKAALKQTAALGLPAWASGNPEGFLYPATYPIVPHSTTALQILQAAVRQFNVEIGQINLAATAKTDQFTELQVITEASLLEGEVGPKYYADVARTLDNRLKINMPLQLDSTIAFITGDYSYTLSAAQRHTPSPYNTFLHADLPPGPINSPSIEAIKAVLHPASSANDWTYFITVNKHGLTKFTSSYSQFLIWSNEAKQNGV